MSERQINDPQPTPQALASVDASARGLASARRRRFIKLGSAAVPTALTLASRPVMAWDCNTASTWGSAQGVSNTHSSYTRSRDSLRLFADETYTLYCWVNNSTRPGLASSPWTLSPLSCSTSSSSGSYFRKYTVASLLAGEGTIAGIGDTSVPVWNILKNDPTNYPLKTGNSSNDFTRLMLVAWLNYRVQNAKLLKCLKPGSVNSLVAFGKGTYVDVKGATWGQTDVVKYLKKNYIACNDDNCA